MLGRHIVEQKIVDGVRGGEDDRQDLEIMMVVLNVFTKFDF